MSGPESREIDLLEALGDGIDDLLAAIEATEESSAYLEGQQRFFEHALGAIPEAGEEERPQGVLERVASGLDVELSDGSIADAPLDEERAGVLGAWGICIGYVEGFHAGARRVIAEVEQTTGMEGEIDER